MVYFVLLIEEGLKTGRGNPIGKTRVRKFVWLNTVIPSQDAANLLLEIFLKLEYLFLKQAVEVEMGLFFLRNVELVLIFLASFRQTTSFAIILMHTSFTLVFVCKKIFYTLKLNLFYSRRVLIPKQNNDTKKKFAFKQIMQHTSTLKTNPCT